jgi:flagellar hook assembly protein FlgD
VIGQPTGVAETRETPVTFGLLQNYPNPFNPSTVISFQLPVNSHVTLQVFDVNGREVATLISQKMAAGKHQVNWEASALASGVYVYQLQAGNLIASKKLLFIK